MLARLLRPDFISDYLLRRRISQSSRFVNGRVLDIGCGDRRYETLLTGRDVSYIGLELPSNNRQAFVRDTARAECWGSALNLPFKNDAFETIVCFQVLEHLPDPQQAVKEMSEAIQPNGIVVCTAPQMYHEHAVPHDYFRFTQYGLKHLFERQGFVTVDVLPCGGFFARIGQKISYALRCRNRLLFVVGRIIAIPLHIVFLVFDRLRMTRGDYTDNIIIARKVRS